MNVAFITLGCKVNIYESNAIKEELTSRGHVITDDEENADCYIINTCTVTNMADRKSRQGKRPRHLAGCKERGLKLYRKR